MSKNQEPARTYNRVKINEGQESKFLELVRTMADIISREPACLQVEAFYNKDSQTVVWLESFEDVDGIVAHFSNPELLERQPQVFPLIQIDVYRVLGQMPELTDLLTPLKEGGIPVEIGEAWDGTARLSQAQQGQPTLQCNFESNVKDYKGVRRISDRMKVGVANRPGVLQLQNFDFGNQQVHTHMAYADQSDFMEWALSDDNAPNAAELPALLDVGRFEVFGEVNSETKKYMDSWGAIYFEKVAGMSRFHQLADPKTTTPA